jgi:hypothetical protein
LKPDGIAALGEQRLRGRQGEKQTSRMREI